MSNFRMKDEDSGEIPVAFVIKSENSQVTGEEIMQYISKQVNFNYSPVSFLLVNAKGNKKEIDKLYFHWLLTKYSQHDDDAGDILQENKTSVLRRSHSQGTIRQNLEEKFEREVGRWFAKVNEDCKGHIYFTLLSCLFYA